MYPRQRPAQALGTAGGKGGMMKGVRELRELLGGSGYAKGAFKASIKGEKKESLRLSPIVKGK